MTRYITILAALALAACSTTTSSTSNLSTAIADAQGAFTALTAQLPALEAVDPSLVSPANQAKIAVVVAQANQALSAISATSAATAAAPVLQQVDGYINTITSLASGVVPPPWGLLIQALAVLEPSIEAAVNPMLAAAAVAPVAHPAVPDIATARATFARYAKP